MTSQDEFKVAERLNAETAVIESLKWIDAVIWATGSAAGIIVITKLIGVTEFTWSGITLRTSQAWIIFSLLTVAHLYSGVLAIRALRAYWPVSTDNSRRLLYGQVVGTGGILVRGLTPRIEVFDEDEIRVRYKMNHGDPTAWAALSGFLLLLCATTPFSADRTTIIYGFVAALIAQINWIIGSHWILALSDLVNPEASVYFRRTDNAGIRVLGMGSGGYFFSKMPWIYLPLWTVLHAGVLLASLFGGLIFLAIRAGLWLRSRLRECRNKR